MSLNESLVPEFDHEMANTRRTIERVPTDKFDYKPHPKSGSMGWLAGHLSMLSAWLSMTMEHDVLVLDELRPPDPPKTSEELMALFDRNAEQGRKALAAATDESLNAIWKMTVKGKTVLEMPRIQVVREVILKHMIHHRGQMTVYLRLNDIPVPALYGPSADEGESF